MVESPAFPTAGTLPGVARARAPAPHEERAWHGVLLTYSAQHGGRGHESRRRRGVMGGLLCRLSLRAPAQQPPDDALTEPLRLPAPHWLSCAPCPPHADRHADRAGDRTFQGPIASPAHHEDVSSRGHRTKNVGRRPSGISLRLLPVLPLATLPRVPVTLRSRRRVSARDARDASRVLQRPATYAPPGGGWCAGRCGPCGSAE